MATKKQNIKNEIKSKLYDQYYENGKGKSRHEEKRRTGNYAHYNSVYARASLKSHLSRAGQLTNWLKDRHPEVRSTQDITRDIAKEYLQHQQERGLSVRTVEADMSLLNRLKVSSGDWNRKEIMTKKEAGIRKRSQKEVTNNRGEKPRVEYTDYQRQAIMFGQSFGLRKSEIVNQEENKYFAVTANSLYEKDDRIYCAVFGKSGHFRTSECLESHQDMIREEYGHYIQQVQELPTGEQLKQAYNPEERLFQKDYDHNVRTHVDSRQYYVEHKLAELEQSDREFELSAQNQLKSGANVYKTNGVEMRRDHAQHISESLGHHRIYELKSYVGVQPQAASE